MYDGFEVLFRQQQGGGNRHAAVGAVHNVVEHGGLKHQIPVHKQDVIVPQMFTGAVDGVNIVCVRVARIVHKREVDRQAEGTAVFDEYTVIVAGGHHDLGDSCAGDEPQLAGENRFLGCDLRHALRMFRGEHTHPVTQAGV